MSSLLSSLSSGTNSLLESPTGTGKTLSLLCSTLSFQKNFQKVVIGDWIKKKYPRFEFEVREVLRYSKEEMMVKRGQFEEMGVGMDDRNGEMRRYEKKRVENMKEMIAKGGDEGRIVKEGKELFDSCMGSKWFPKIIYLTRTHAQIKQVVSELKKIKSDIKVCILGSKDRYCINKSCYELKDSFERDDECKNQRKYNRCKYYANIQRFGSFEKLYNSGLPTIYDIEELKETATNCKVCPYFLSNQVLIDQCELLICPYNYVIDEKILKALDMKKQLENSILIFDEAHNIEDALRSVVSGSISLVECESCIKEFNILIKRGIEEEAHKELKVFLENFCRYYNGLTNFEKNDSYNQEKSKTLLTHEFNEFFKACGIDKNSIKKSYGLMQLIFKTANANEKNSEADNLYTLSTKAQKFLENLFIPLKMMTKHKENYFIVLYEKDNQQRRVDFLAMDPSMAIEELKETVYSIILTSGTLSPLNSFSSELALEFKSTYEGGHVVDIYKQVYISGVKCLKSMKNLRLLGTYKNVKENGEMYYSALGESIIKLSSVIPYGILVFFPSYFSMTKTFECWKKKGMDKRLEKIKKIFKEVRGSNKSKFNKIVAKYKKCIEKAEEKKSKTSGGIFFGIARGKLSEGISFSGNQSRGVIVISIPFPSINDKAIKLKKVWNNRHKKNRRLLSGNDWYSLQAWRAVNQALGRCIRSADDYGSIILLDERYTKYKVKELPKWISGRFQCREYLEDCVDDLKSFFKNAIQDYNVKQKNKSIFQKQKKNTITNYFSNNGNNNNNMNRNMNRNNGINGFGYLDNSDSNNQNKKKKVPLQSFRFDPQNNRNINNNNQNWNQTGNNGKEKKDNPFSRFIYQKPQSQVPLRPLNDIPEMEDGRMNNHNQNQGFSRNVDFPSTNQQFSSQNQIKFSPKHVDRAKRMNTSSYSQYQNGSQPNIVGVNNPNLNNSYNNSYNYQNSNQNQSIIVGMGQNSDYYSDSNGVFQKNGRYFEYDNNNTQTLPEPQRLFNEHQKPYDDMNDYGELFSDVKQEPAPTQIITISNTFPTQNHTPKSPSTNDSGKMKKRKKKRKNSSQKTIQKTMDTFERGNSNILSCFGCGNLLCKNMHLSFLDRKTIQIPDDRPYLNLLNQAFTDNDRNYIIKILSDNTESMRDNITDRVYGMKNKTLINQSQKSIDVIEDLQVPIPSNCKDVENIEIYAPTDKTVYKLLFCVSCGNTCIGCEIIMINNSNVEGEVGDIFLWKHKNYKKRKPSFLDDNQLNIKRKKVSNSPQFFHHVN